MSKMKSRKKVLMGNQHLLLMGWGKDSKPNCEEPCITPLWKLDNNDEK